MNVRTATREDVPAIVEMLADDPLGSLREDFRHPLPELYYRAFEKIDSDPNQYLQVVETEGRIAGTYQLTFIPYLTYRGGVRAQVEAVRVHKDFRSKGLGTEIFRHIIKQAREGGAHLLQLTSDSKRPDALRFYESLGFKATHHGLKLNLRD